VDMSGDLWKTEDSVLFFMYTVYFCRYRQFSRQVSTTNKPKMLAIVILSFCCPFDAVFSLILETCKGDY